MTIVVFSLMNKVGATYEGLPRYPRSSLLGPTRDTLGKLFLLLLLTTLKRISLMTINAH